MSPNDGVGWQSTNPLRCFILSCTSVSSVTISVRSATIFCPYFAHPPLAGPHRRAYNAAVVDSAALHAVLHEHFGFREFLEGQERVIATIAAGRDTLVIMPTGGGKSLCYQLPALILDGITVVVSPLIALMKDQVDALTAKGVPATFINSSLTPADIDARIAAMQRGQYRLVYIAPERFKSPRFIEALAPLSIALFAIDEAHCISQWGHDFRPDYLRLKWALKDLGQPPVVALTATATPEVRADIIEQLALGKFGRPPPEVFVTGFARHNLTLAVTRAKGKTDKLARLADTIRELKTGIVYCATRKHVEQVAAALAADRIRCIAYHGALPAEQRKTAQDKFMSGTINVAVATNAFGMGIDRPDLRFVCHYDIPGSVEAYYQEAGRAGRDGEPARCELLFNYADVRTQEFFIDGANPTRAVLAELHGLLGRLCRAQPVELPITEIAEQVRSADNEMAVGSALHLLERAGYIHREYRPGSRTYTTRLVEPVKPFDALAIDFDKLTAKRERDLDKLGRVIAYADHHGCRHRFILGYFGDAEAGDQCSVCDNCLTHTGIPRLPTEDETVMIQKTLSCVARVAGRYGRARIVQTLVGSRSKEVLDAGLDRLSTYGLLKDVGTDYVWSLLNQLIKTGCVAVSNGQYPTLALTELGGDVMRRTRSVPLILPPLPAKKVPAAAKTRREKAPTVEAPYDEKLFEALRAWRRAKAETGNMPAYLIYPDATLKELARERPETHDQLLTIRGIGPAKARRFGAETLAVIRAAQ